MTMIKTEIRASLGEKLLANADRYYTANLSQMIDEIVQNARRAGARMIRATLDGDTLVVSDDGRGLTAGEAPVLLQLGGSNNTDRVEDDENAAGIGFFSLAHADVVVRSRDWQMEIPRKAFVAKTTATLTTGLDEIAGLSLRLSGLAERQGYDRLASGAMLVEATRYSGLRLELQGFGDRDGAHDPADFLHDMLKVDVSQHRTVTAHGLTITVARMRHATEHTVIVNVFGKVIHLNDKAWTRDLVTEAVGLMDPAKHGSSHVRVVHHAVRVMIDVHDTTLLRLQLPERNRPIEDDGYRVIGQTIRRIYADLLAGIDGPNGVPMDAPIRSLGNIPAPQVAVWSGLNGRYDDTKIVGITTPAGILDERGRLHPLADCVALDHADYLAPLLASERAKGSTGDLMFVRYRELQAAYGAKAATAIETIAFLIKMDGEEHRIEIEYSDLGAVHEALETADLDPNDRIIDDAAVALRIRGREHVIPIPGIVFAQDDDRENAGIFAVRDQGETPLVDLLANSIDWWNEEDPFESARDTWMEIYRAKIAALLGTSAELLHERLERAIESEIRDLPEGLAEGETMVITVRVSRDRGIIRADVKSAA